MADNYIERQQEQYEARKAAWKQAQKYGKKKMRKTQILSRAYITTLRNTIQIQINTLTVELENFNSSHSLKNGDRKKGKSVTMDFSKQKAAA